MRDPVAAPVLIVEDNTDTRDVLERVLLISGYDTVTTRDGEEALDYLNAGGRPSVIVLDIRMPRMDGVTFRETLSADDRWADIPIVVFTALPAPRVSGVVGVVRKGTDDPQSLLDLIERATTQ